MKTVPRNLLLLCLPWICSVAAQASDASATEFYTHYQPPLASPECPEYSEDGVLLHYDFADLVDSAKSRSSLGSSRSAMVETVKVHDHRHHRGSKVAAKSTKISSTRGIMYGNDWMLEAQLYQEIHHNSVPQITLEGIRPCLEYGRQYLLTAQVRVVPFSIASKSRLRRETNEFALTDCAKLGENCVEIWTSSAKTGGNNDDEVATEGSGDEEEVLDERIVWAEPQSHHSRYGDVFTVATTIAFGPGDSMLHFRGGPLESGIQVMEFTLKIPPQEAFHRASDTDGAEDSFMLLCQDLVPPNGNAEIVGRHPFPIYDMGSESNPIWSTTSVVVEQDETDNHYFAVRGRASNDIQGSDSELLTTMSSEGGLSWDIPRECLNQPYQTGAVYRVQADVRIHVPTITEEHTKKMIREGRGIQLEFSIRAHDSSARLNDGEDFFQGLVICPPSYAFNAVNSSDDESDSNTWVKCDGEFNVPAEFDDANISRYQVLVKTLETKFVDYDVDNMSITLSLPTSDSATTTA